MQMYMMYLYVPEMKLMDQGLEPEHDEHTHTHTHTHTTEVITTPHSPVRIITVYLR